MNLRKQEIENRLLKELSKKVILGGNDKLLASIAADYIIKEQDISNAYKWQGQGIIMAIKHRRKKEVDI
jgi:hypothetical protein